jgi:hypothetical protein
MRLSQRVFQLVAFGMIAAAPAFAQGGMAGMNHDDADKSVAGGGKLPAGWSARTDKNAPITNVKLVKMGEGWHVTMGPAAVLYREADKASGNYHASATLTQSKADYPEGYGLIIGGRNLSEASQKYTYFLVREDGKFIIKKRDGSVDERGKNPSTIVDWTDNAAINKKGADGKATNEVAIDVSGGKVSFKVNGKEVYTTDASKVDTDGIVGLRVNHNLDVHVAGFGVQKT